MKLEHSAVARCGPEDVWKAFTDSTRWSEWSSLFAGLHWTGGDPWHAGSEGVLELAQPSFKLKLAIKEAQPSQRIVWTGAVMGVNIENSFDFQGQPDGATLMRAVIDLSGPGTFFINEDMKKKGMAAFVPWFEGLRSHAERLAATK